MDRDTEQMLRKLAEKHDELVAAVLGLQAVVRVLAAKATISEAEVRAACGEVQTFGLSRSLIERMAIETLRAPRPPA